MSRRLDLIGQRFDRLVVVEISDKDKWGHYKWKCKCDCGNIKIVYGGSLKKGATKSCGCLQKENRIKYNLSRHPLYQILAAIKERCYNKKHQAYKNYGGRGIKVCKQWKNDFKAFYDFCIDNGWEKGLQIDREDNNGNYEPDNCRFVTHKENTRNRRNSKTWVINGKKYSSTTQAAKYEKIGKETVRVWCGIIGNHGKPPKAKPGCYAYNKY